MCVHNPVQYAELVASIQNVQTRIYLFKYNFVHTEYSVPRGSTSNHLVQMH